jgi:hypothetical protein
MFQEYVVNNALNIIMLIIRRDIVFLNVHLCLPYLLFLIKEFVHYNVQMIHGLIMLQETV